MLLIWLLALLPISGTCSYNNDALQTLSQDEFDQDMRGGWRSLADKKCYVEAAQVLHDYRVGHRISPKILYWHEGQMRAFASQSKQAITLFNQSKKNGDDRWGWNIYVDGSVAFLKHDLAGLKAARAQLAALPRPTDFKSEIRENGQVYHFGWPLNLPVMDALLKCFDKPYQEAYGCR